MLRVSDGRKAGRNKSCGYRLPVELLHSRVSGRLNQPTLNDGAEA
jgi:hypothetical protein